MESECLTEERYTRTNENAGKQEARLKPAPFQKIRLSKSLEVNNNKLCENSFKRHNATHYSLKHKWMLNMSGWDVINRLWQRTVNVLYTVNPAITKQITPLISTYRIRASWCDRIKTEVRVRGNCRTDISLNVHIIHTLITDICIILHRAHTERNNQILH